MLALAVLAEHPGHGRDGVARTELAELVAEIARRGTL
jgi:hypothetical protein